MPRGQQKRGAAVTVVQDQGTVMAVMGETPPRIAGSADGCMQSESRGRSRSKREAGLC